MTGSLTSARALVSHPDEVGASRLSMAAGERFVERLSMSHLVTPYGTFNLIQYDTEQEFERAIVAHVNDIFGERRIYLDCKRRIGAKDGKQSVPDAYLIDVSSPSDPQLYVVENEISKRLRCLQCLIEWILSNV